MDGGAASERWIYIRVGRGSDAEQWQTGTDKENTLCSICGQNHCLQGYTSTRLLHADTGHFILKQGCTEWKRINDIFLYFFLTYFSYDKWETTLEWFSSGSCNTWRLSILNIALTIGPYFLIPLTNISSQPCDLYLCSVQTACCFFLLWCVLVLQEKQTISSVTYYVHNTHKRAVMINKVEDRAKLQR